VAIPAFAAAQPVAKPWDALLISSFNIQVFGESKLSKPQVVEILARVVRKFDIVAIQEVRAKSDDIIPRFIQAVNADGSRYHYLIGPREGRTSSKEQYVFVYDTTRVEVDPSSAGVFPDPSDRLHRPPMCARFRTRITPAQLAFSFWLVNTHTDPDEVPQELAALADVFEAMQRAHPDEDDVILLGDLNAGPPQFKSFQRIPGIGEDVRQPRLRPTGYERVSGGLGGARSAEYLWDSARDGARGVGPQPRLGRLPSLRDPRCRAAAAGGPADDGPLIRGSAMPWQAFAGESPRGSQPGPLSEGLSCPAGQDHESSRPRSPSDLPRQEPA